MDGSSAHCPEWIANKISDAGGSISFHQYMDWALNDPEHGAYSSGHLKLGRKGDFATSPSLGSEFAELLGCQLVDWLEQLQKKNINNLPLSLIEAGPGEGDLVFDLIRVISEISPYIFSKLELLLVDINEGMIEKQKKLLSSISTIPIRWASLDELSENPVIGVILAHEVLDALPVERIIFRDGELFRQGIKLQVVRSKQKLSYVELPLSLNIKESLSEFQDTLSIQIPPEDISNGWCSELHLDLKQWMSKASKSLIFGSMLIIDYALEAGRYYKASRNNGTLMSYRNQSASSEVLNNPGYYDITSHLCIDVLKFFADKSNWNYLGEARQGLALLALGLSERLYSLQKLPNDQLAAALARREALLRLVDPAGLGEFRWMAFQVDNENRYLKGSLTTKFLANPDG